MDPRVREDDGVYGWPPDSNAITGAAFKTKMAEKAGQCLSLLFCIGLMVTSATHAQTPTPEMPQMKPELELRLKKLETELRCLVCQNQTLAESPAGLAGDLRREVRLLAESGKNDNEIKEHLKARYGDFVLYKPELDRRTWLLWFGPFVLLAGAILVWVMIRRRSGIEGLTVNMDPHELRRATALLNDEPMSPNRADQSASSPVQVDRDLRP